MSVRPAERTALLVIRAWLEPGAEPRLRARITQTIEIERPATASRVVATREEVTAAVERWLDVFIGDGALTRR